MKYTLICFTFNIVKSEESASGSKMVLRNNWTEAIHDNYSLAKQLKTYGIEEPHKYITDKLVTKVWSNFNLPNTRICIHIVSPVPVFEKKYVCHHDNKIPSYMQNHIKVGDVVIVKDGSYMTDEHGKDVSGLYFTNNLYQHELLTVTRINIPLPTDYSSNGVLGRHNNCEIQGFDGKKYHCSLINISAFK